MLEKDVGKITEVITKVYDKYHNLISIKRVKTQLVYAIVTIDDSEILMASLDDDAIDDAFRDYERTDIDVVYYNKPIE